MKQLLRSGDWLFLDGSVINVNDIKSIRRTEITTRDGNDKTVRKPAVYISLKHNDCISMHFDNESDAANYLLKLFNITFGKKTQIPEDEIDDEVKRWLTPIKGEANTCPKCKSKNIGMIDCDDWYSKELGRVVGDCICDDCNFYFYQHYQYIGYSVDEEDEEE